MSLNELIVLSSENGGDHINLDEDMPEPDNGPGPGGDDSDPEQNDPDKNDKPDKGKGKAKAITPESIPEQQSSDDENFQKNLEKAKLESLKGHTQEDTQGESSKQGATLQEREYTGAQEEMNNKLSHYRDICDNRLLKVREFNDINEKLQNNNDNMTEADREFLLNESIKARKEVGEYDNYIQYLKNMLNIYSEEESSPEENSSEAFTSEDSSDEESRPSKRPRH